MSPSQHHTLTGRAVKTVMMAGAAAVVLAALAIARPSVALAPLVAPQRLPAPAVDEPRGAGLESVVLSGG